MVFQSKDGDFRGEGRSDRSDVVEQEVKHALGSTTLKAFDGVILHILNMNGVIFRSRECRALKVRVFFDSIRFRCEVLFPSCISKAHQTKDGIWLSMRNGPGKSLTT